MDFKHVPVLLNECMENLDIKSNGIYVDCTLGGAGHSINILKRLGNDGRLVGIDQDMDAIRAAKKKLEDYKNVTYVHDNFYNIDNILENLKIDAVDGILMDLGVSSYQLDEAERGFSYMHDAKLDMRMNRESNFSAYEIVNKYEKEKLYRVIRDYGEERFANRIADNIIKAREEKPIETTFELADVIKASIPAKFRRDGPHPAKRTFQAIRIEVNSELKILDKAIEDGVNRLKSGGRIAIITFHSLEDRIVKTKFKKLHDPCECPKDLPCVCGKKPIIDIVTRKPIAADSEELELNSRSRSAKLRVAQKI